ncbi:MAG: hypothetical protein JWM40_1367, partial [Frankiales bacterium]|nr:hypothetical protein [Frankiales bacterium]
PQRCRAFPSPTAQPPAYAPKPGTLRRTFAHDYQQFGRTYKIVVRVASVNDDCRPYGPKAETTSVTLQVVVPAASPTPTATSAT